MVSCNRYYITNITHTIDIRQQVMTFLLYLVKRTIDKKSEDNDDNEEVIKGSQAKNETHNTNTSSTRSTTIFF